MNPRDSARHFLRRVVAWPHYPVGRVLFRIRWRGLDHVPRSGPAVLCANHASYLDAGALPFPIYFRRGGRMVRFMALEDYFTGLLGSYLRLFEAFPVPEDGASVRAFRRALSTLREGRLLGIFPEAGRTTDGTLQPFHPGAARIAAEAGVPIIPATINGTWDLWPPHRKFPRFGPIEVIYHPPVPADPDRRKDEEYIRNLTRRIQEIVARDVRPHAAPPARRR